MTATASPFAPGVRVHLHADPMHGTVVEYPAVDPDGIAHPELVAIQFDDDVFELCQIVDVELVDEPDDEDDGPAYPVDSTSLTLATPDGERIATWIGAGRIGGAVELAQERWPGCTIVIRPGRFRCPP